MTRVAGRILALTGAAGMMASLLRPHLAGAGYQVRLIDLRAPSNPPGASENVFLGSVADRSFMVEALAGVDVLIHLAGIHHEAAWEDLLEANVCGTFTALDAAREVGVRRVLLASSTHAVGYARVSAAAAVEPVYPRPDTLYGFTKCAMENLGSLYADRFGMKIVSARIGTGCEVPVNGRTMSTWLSPGDMFRLVEATATDVGAPGHHVVWAVSRNTGGWANLEAGRRIGFMPEDDAAQFREGLCIDESDELRSEDLLGGNWAGPNQPLGVRPSR